MIHSGNFLVSRSAEAAFDLVASPEQFAPLLPDFESMIAQDATHFTLRLAVSAGPINGDVNLAMEVCEVLRPSRVEYRGQGVIAGGPLTMTLRFQFAPALEGTELNWQGEVTLGGALAFMAGDLLEAMGRQNFDWMAERLRDCLNQEAPASPKQPPLIDLPPDFDPEI
jgi:carbon monoxide dehydrogenase subunit G